MDSVDVDLFDPATQEDWYPAYRILHEKEPIYKIPGTTIYVLTKYKDILTVVNDTVTFSTQAEAHGGDLLIKYPEARQYYKDHGLGKEEGIGRWTPLSVDPPDHRKYRALVDRFFQGKGLTRARPIIEKVVSDLIDTFDGDGEVEFVKQFAVPLPVTVITTLLGLPLEDMEQLQKWSFSWALPFARGLSLEQEMKVAKDGVDFQRYIKSYADKRRADPQEDIITHLVQARFDGVRPLTDLEIASIVDHLYIGGNETTTFALSSGMWLMLRQPEIYRKLLADPSKIKNFSEEVLRLESPTQGLYRTVVKDTELSGTPIPKGSTVHMRFAAANRDEEMFPNGDVLDIDRPNAGRHMAFSLAEHHCPGSGLSRLEQVIAYEHLLKRLPKLDLAPGRNDFKHLPGFVLRALLELHLTFEPARG